MDSIDSVPIMMLIRQLDSVKGLVSACPNEKAKARLLDTHCQSMLVQMKGLNLTYDDVKGFGDALKSSVFTEDQVAQLVAAASDSLLKQAGAAPSRRTLQKLVDLRPYLTKSEVESFQGPAGLSVKIHLAVRCCMRLGLTNPSEPAAGTILKTVEGFNCSELADPQTFLNSLHLLKQQFKSERKKIVPADDYLVEFNGIPGDMPRNLYMKAFKDEEPAGDVHATSTIGRGPLRINNSSVAGKRGQVDGFQNPMNPCMNPMNPMNPMNGMNGILTFASMVNSWMGHGNAVGHVHGAQSVVQGQQAIGNGQVAGGNGQVGGVQPQDGKSQLAIEDLRSKPKMAVPALPIEKPTQSADAPVEPQENQKPLTPAEQARTMLEAWDQGPLEGEDESKKPRGRGRGRGRGGGRGRGRGRGRGKVGEDDSKMAMKSLNTKKVNPMKSTKVVKATPKQSMKRPSASTSVRGVKHVGREVPGISWEERLKRRPHGCPSCRFKPGCCPSCWK